MRLPPELAELLPPDVRERINGLFRSPVTIETMIFTDEPCGLSGYRLSYGKDEEARALRRHRWIVWVICEMLGRPHPRNGV